MKNINIQIEEQTHRDIKGIAAKQGKTMGLSCKRSIKIFCRGR